ncbi:hypothetical protein QBC37DRAFT_374456 [Rhypophila decipiens]|uniref:Uncharacterized protein n=1 Tax=Rhypophila decipiens TaxID=261697 RepID=A0AAN6Y5F0_9PEZI|nr:hypothetical protein QBC37DRAFT_374456 [Rhypophila decipiens]
MKFSILSLSLTCLGGGVLAVVHTDYRPDRTVEKIYNLRDHEARGLIHDLLPTKKKKGCGKPPTYTLTTSTISAFSSTPSIGSPVDPSNSSPSSEPPSSSTSASIPSTASSQAVAFRQATVSSQATVPSQAAAA